MSQHENARQSALRELLNEPGIAKARPIHQPADGALLTLEITQVLPYDRNPRKTKNPKYDEIKASILARGIEQTIKVTQRPGMPPHQFMISGGGNTRLAILHEFYEETGDPRWQSCQFIYEDWKSESSNVIAHLIENTARGGMTLIDKANTTTQPAWRLRFKPFSSRHKGSHVTLQTSHSSRTRNQEKSVTVHPSHVAAV